MDRQQKKQDLSSSQGQQRKRKDYSSVQEWKEKIGAQEGQESKGSANAFRHVDVGTEKHVAKARGKHPQRGQGRITNPKTNESNQYR